MAPKKPRTRQAPRSRAIAAMSEVFQTHGYEGASLSSLGAASGLSKAGLYHHFPKGKSDMAAQVLTASGLAFTQLILTPLRSSDTASERLSAMLDGAVVYYDSGQINCLMNTLALGEGLALFGNNIKGAMAAWVSALAPTLEELGAENGKAMAHRIIAEIQGALIQTRIFQDPDLFKNAVQAIRRRYR